MSEAISIVNRLGLWYFGDEGRNACRLDLGSGIDALSRRDAALCKALLELALDDLSQHPPGAVS